MQVILLSSSGRWRVRLASGGLGLVVALALLGWAAAFYAGFSSGIGEAPLARNDLELERRAMLYLQQRQLDDAIERAGNELAALSARTARLQAGLDRIDALGARLVDLAALDEREFAFDQQPGLGGRAPPASAEAPSVADFVAELELLGQQLDDRRAKLRGIERLWMMERLDASSVPSGRPVRKGWVSSSFGWRTDPVSGRRAFHDGVDVAGRYKSPVIAVAAGVVTAADSRRGYGNVVEIRHPGGLSTRYAHNARNLVKVGDRVARGDVIALMGSTGRSTGAHVHFEVLRNGEPINPRPYLSGKG